MHFSSLSVILGRSHYLLYTLAAAMQPRMLVTFDEDLNPLPVPVRVGLVSHQFTQYITQNLATNFFSMYLEQSFNLVMFSLSGKLLFFSLGCGCGRPSRQAQDHHRFPDTHNTRTASLW